MLTRSHRWILFLSLVLAGLALLIPGAAGAEDPATAASDDAEAAFARLAALEGAWEGRNQDGDSVAVRYETVAGGSALLERYQNRSKDHEMITVYHRDGERLMLTHYCVAGNQPRMVAAPGPGPEIAFEFAGATGLASAADGHMHRAVLRPDGDRLTSEWTFYRDSQPTFTARLELERVATAVSAAAGGE